MASISPWRCAGLIFRADGETIPRFEAEGAGPFQYNTSKKTVTVASYWHVPERLLDDPDELADWARDALGAARRAALKKRTKARKPTTKAAGKKGTEPAGKTKAAAKKKPANKRKALS